MYIICPNNYIKAKILLPKSIGRCFKEIIRVLDDIQNNNQTSYNEKLSRQRTDSITESYKTISSIPLHIGQIFPNIISSLENFNLYETKKDKFCVLFTHSNL